jgi:glutamate-1-semialdehyde 2,1-aminomutase
MAAALATIDALRTDGAVAGMTQAGQRLRDGLAAQAKEYGIPVRQTGPVQMPYLTFDDDDDHAMRVLFSDVCIRNGTYLHPKHNWFICSAHSDRDIDRALEATDLGLAAVGKQFG